MGELFLKILFCLFFLRSSQDGASFLCFLSSWCRIAQWIKDIRIHRLTAGTHNYLAN
ncbi:hypothetical protein QJS10_CPB22g00763 [Acorus calamus]|uniref:Uncharacterized protein n=1 Tax=Acorus calamus TaxID=4465 RepID=A0AAV9BZJ8_ACOCL|nr:hypothetical protein QJS10_CPB22g00763 [Acorus calamus]